MLTQYTTYNAINENIRDYQDETVQMVEMVFLEHQVHAKFDISSSHKLLNLYEIFTTNIKNLTTNSIVYSKKIFCEIQ